MYNLAIIGYGGMGGWHRDNIEKRIPLIKAAGAFDTRIEALDAAKRDGLKVYASLADVLNDKSIDIVTIATPNNFHKQIAVDALKAGKNVVCEKPVALNAAELTEIIAAAKNSGKLFSVHQNRRWDKDYRTVKKIIDDGVIGSPHFIESRVQGSNGAMHGWRGFKINGGGILLDWGVHLIDQLMDLFGCKVTSVCAHFLSVFSKEVDDNVKFLLRFENGASASAEITTNCLYNLPRWHVQGSGGTAVVFDWDCSGKIVKIKDGSKVVWDDVIIYTEAGPTRTMAPRPDYSKEELSLPSVETDWADYYKNYAAALEGKEELIVKPEQCLRVMKVIDLLFESDKAGHGLGCEI